MYLCNVKLFYFNYSHELALANGRGNYISPLQVRSMEEDLMSLAAFCASVGDAVVVSEHRLSDCNSFYASLCPEVNFVSLSCLPQDFVLTPWGVDAQLFWLLHRIDAVFQSDFDNIDVVRRLASRRVAVEILSRLNADLEGLPLCGKSQFCSDEESVIVAVKEYEHSVLKAPWSSSGRGLRFADGELIPPVSGWCKRILSSQGGVVVEPLYDKVADLAAEFISESSGKVRYVGLSSFFTSERCGYLGNIVGSQKILRELVFHDFNEEVYNQVVKRLETILSEKIQGHYVGPLGVDMMICREKGHLLLHPCVEMNVRTTMGLFSMHLERLLGTGVSAFFRIRYDDYPERLREFVQNFSLPHFDSDGGVISGCLLLTPLCQDSHYVAWLEANS